MCRAALPGICAAACVEVARHYGEWYNRPVWAQGMGPGVGIGAYMNIIIVGCGKVGYTLVEQLCKEDHNIVVVDEKESKVRNITDDLDALGVVGNGVSYQVLQEAGIQQADLLIAVTGSDELNLLCCVLARKASGCKTIARVRGPVYSQELDFLKESLGIAMCINPEAAAAAEIARLFQFPQAIKVDLFSKGRIELLHFRIGEQSILKDKEIQYIRNKINQDVLVCIVRRGEEVFIPGGSFVMREGDVLGIVSTPQKAGEFFSRIGITAGKARSAMIVGGGKIGYYLAKRLLEVGINTKIIDMNFARCEELSALLPKATVICGDGTDKDLLSQEGLERVEGFAALTELDEENILLSLYAKKVSKAKVITKVNRITFSSVINDLHMDSIVYPRLVTADTILRYTRALGAASGYDRIENLYKLDDGGAEAMEFIISEESPVTQKPLGQLRIKPGVLICSIRRGRKIILPNGQSQLAKGDHVVLVQRGNPIDSIGDILEDGR